MGFRSFGYCHAREIDDATSKPIQREPAGRQVPIGASTPSTASASLSTLHQDIRRFMALAHPTLQQEAREAIACDYFIDALDDADFAL